MQNRKLSDCKLANAELCFLYFLPAERRSAGTIANVVLATRDIMQNRKLSDCKLANAELCFLYFLPAERKSTGTIANVVLATRILKTFGFFTLHSSFFT